MQTPRVSLQDWWKRLRFRRPPAPAEPTQSATDKAGASPAADLPQAGEFTEGQVLESKTSSLQFKIIDKIITGNQGVVYIADVPQDGGRYALKTFQARYLSEPDMREQFEYEALHWVMVNPHPNVVSALWMERLYDLPFLVLEYMPGGSLMPLIAKKPLLPPTAFALAIQICEGMSHVHENRGLIHRDIKPSNCLLTEDHKTLKVADFGLSRVFDEAYRRQWRETFPESAEENVPTTSGTIRYKAPEQFDRNARLDARTDIHAFGVTFYEMMTADHDPEFVGNEAYDRIREKERAFHLSREVVELILHCVATDPRDRPPSFREVRGTLADLYRRQTGQSYPDTPVSPGRTARELCGLGISMERLGHYPQAVYFFDRGLILDPEDISLLEGKSAALCRDEKYAEALKVCDHALSIAGYHAGLLNNKGRALMGLRRFDEAAACFDAALRLSPRSTVLLRNRGEIDFEERRFREAIHWYDRGLQIDSGDINLLENKGYALLELEEYAEAIQVFDRGLRIAPQASRMWKGRGVAVGNLGRDEEALECYDKGSRIDPKDADMHRLMGLTLYGRRRYSEAILEFDRGLEFEPADSELLKGKGAACCQLGQLPEALECFQEALQRARDAREREGRKREDDECEDNVREYSDLYKNIARVLIGLGRAEESLGWIRDGIDLSPGDPFLWNNRGLALHHLGRYREALAAYERGLEIDPENDTLRRNRAMTLSAMEEA